MSVSATPRANRPAPIAKHAKLEVEKIRKMNRATYDTALDPKKLQPPLDLAWRYHGLEKPIRAGDLIVNV